MGSCRAVRAARGTAGHGEVPGCKQEKGGRPGKRAAQRGLGGRLSLHACGVITRRWAIVQRKRQLALSRIPTALGFRVWGLHPLWSVVAASLHVGWRCLLTRSPQDIVALAQSLLVASAALLMSEASSMQPVARKASHTISLSACIARLAAQLIPHLSNKLVLFLLILSVCEGPSAGLWIWRSIAYEFVAAGQCNHP